MQQQNDEVENERSTIQELLDEGFSVEEAESIIQSSHDENMNIQPMNTHQCICGHNLMKMVVGDSALYNGDDCACDQCEAKVEFYSPIWHCEETNAHGLYGGFDICSNCINSFDSKSFERQSFALTLIDRFVMDKENVNHENIKHLQPELSDQKNQESNKEQKINSGHLLNTTKIRLCGGCNLNECLCVKNISNVLKKYKSYIDRCKNKQKGANIDEDVYEKTENKYDSVVLLNDFNHVVLCHGDEFEDIYNILKHKIYGNHDCEFSKCSLIRRHRRDRQQISKNDTLLNGLYSATDQIVSQQLLDRVHCHYFHSFDIGYKLNKKDQQDIMNEEIKSNEEYHKIISSKLRLKRKPLHQMKSSKNKFQMVEQYSYGYRFYYWTPYEYYSEVNDPVYFNRDYFETSYGLGHSNSSTPILCWYIKRKYKNVESELLFNDICCISQTQWQCLLQKAKIHYKTDKVKATFCTRQNTAKWYEMKYGDTMSIDHVIAMMIYCNFDFLQCKFTETYREISEEEKAEHVMERHSNYYWLGRCLRECVECFGMKNSTSMKVYHGVNKQFMFKSMNANIKTPFSTTRNYFVAAQFCDNKGMILELNMDRTLWCQHIFDGLKAIEKMNCCDMSWISDYTNEEEIFSVGGLGNFKFESIIEPLGTNYAGCMKALDQISMNWDINNQMKSHLFPSDAQSGSLSEDQYKFNFRLLSHQIWKSYPQSGHAHQLKNFSAYFDKIMDLHFQDITAVNFDVQNSKFFDYFFCHEKHGWVDLDLLVKLMPNIDHVAYSALEKDISFLKNDTIYDYVLSFIESGAQKKLRQIVIPIASQYSEPMQQYLIQYKNAFAKLNWMINIQINDVEKIRNRVQKQMSGQFTMGQLMKMTNVKAKLSRFLDTNNDWSSVSIVIYSK